MLFSFYKENTLYVILFNPILGSLFNKASNKILYCADIITGFMEGLLNISFYNRAES